MVLLALSEQAQAKLRGGYSSSTQLPVLFFNRFCFSVLKVDTEGYFSADVLLELSEI